MYNCITVLQDISLRRQGTLSPSSGHRTFTAPWRMAQMCIFLWTRTHNSSQHCVPFTHTEVWKLIAAAAVTRAVAQFVEPVVFGGYEEVPGQQGADAQEEKDDVDKTVRVLWAVAHGQWHRRMFGQQGRRGALVIAFLILWRLVVVQNGGEVRRVQAGLHPLVFNRFLVAHNWTVAERGKKRGEVRQEMLNSKLWKEKHKKNINPSDISKKCTNMINGALMRFSPWRRSCNNGNNRQGKH